MKTPFLVLTILLMPMIAKSQAEPTISERLGYEKDARLLILHADDLGVAHSVNEASFRALSSNSISSASIMVPCPWLLEVARFARENPEYDLGLHLTLTAEWQEYKWNGVSSSSDIPSLLNEHGFMHNNTGDVRDRANPEEVRREIQAQIDVARKLGIRPTHLDSHMGALFETPDLFRVYVESGIDNKIPVFVPHQALALLPGDSPLTKSIITVEYLGSASPGISAADWEKQYVDLLDNCKPGLNKIIVHLGFNDDELQAVTINHTDFGAEWRSLDLQTVESPSFKKALNDRGIQLVTYREIQQLLYGN